MYKYAQERYTLRDCSDLKIALNCDFCILGHFGVAYWSNSPSWGLGRVMLLGLAGLLCPEFKKWKIALNLICSKD